ncbi:MAG: hypothetical protein IJB81_06040 [Clostridia bacterium]|nr:hypothetical protein [Clostridia bacterium]
MKNRKLLLIVSLILAMTMAMGGTLAYLTDTDEAVNVMTLGNVDIEQIELQRKEGIAYNATLKEGDLEPFEQGQALYPAFPVNNAGTDYSAEMNDLLYWGPYVHTGTAANGLWNENKLIGALDKFVFVENTGSSDAYYRTIIAFECPEGMEYSEGADKEFMMNVNGSNLFTWDNIGYVEVDDVRYLVMVATYQDVLMPGEISHPSLLQVVMTHNATNEDMKKLGETYEILAFSQAVQTKNMETIGANAALNAAFGEVTDKNHPWKDGVSGLPTKTVKTAEDLKAALAEGGIVVLADDVTVTETLNVPAGKDVELILNGDLSYAVSNSGASAIINNKGNLTLSGEGTLSFVAENPDLGTIPAYATNTITNTGTLTIEAGVTVENGSEGGASYAVDNHGIFYLNGGTLKGDRCALRVAKYNADNVVFVMNDGLVTAKTPAWIQLPGSNASVAPNISVTINGGTMQSTEATSADNNVCYTYSFGNSHANTSVTINGGEFLGGTFSIGSGYKGDAPTLTINGGTFEYDVLQWLENNENKVLYAANK